MIWDERYDALNLVGEESPIEWNSSQPASPPPKFRDSIGAPLCLPICRSYNQKTKRKRSFILYTIIPQQIIMWPVKSTRVFVHLYFILLIRFCNELPSLTLMIGIWKWITRWTLPMVWWTVWQILPDRGTDNDQSRNQRHRNRCSFRCQILEIWPKKLYKHCPEMSLSIFFIKCHYHYGHCPWHLQTCFVSFLKILFSTMTVAFSEMWVLLEFSLSVIFSGRLMDNLLCMKNTEVQLFHLPTSQLPATEVSASPADALMDGTSCQNCQAVQLHQILVPYLQIFGAVAS